jgi:ankyrin repeat protein
LVRTNPATTQVANADGSLPIHLALAAKEPSVKVVRILVKESPESLRAANGAGILPLQLAVSRPNRSLALVRRLAEPWPEALKVSGRNGLLPLHVAAASGASLDVLFYLATKGPAAVSAAAATATRAP